VASRNEFLGRNIKKDTKENYSFVDWEELVTLNSDGGLSVKTSSDTKANFTSKEVDEMIALRNKCMSKEDIKSEPKLLPLVEFGYRTKESLCGTVNNRHILVTKMDNIYVEGFDVDNDNKFKKFLRSKIYGDIKLIGVMEKKA
jgi:hypothetical protein